MKKRIIKIGEKFNRLTVIKLVSPPDHVKDKKSEYFDCLCECGKTVKNVLKHNLTRGNSNSCGCYNNDRNREVNTKHGYSKKIPEYSVWEGMKKRCYDPGQNEYKYYGGRGIKVCDRWRESFIDFLNDMGERPNDRSWLDRIDNNGNYEPDNCRWADIKTQQRNKRNVKKYEFDGEMLCIPEIAEKINIDAKVIRNRLFRGWEEKDAFSPLKPNDGGKKTKEMKGNLRKNKYKVTNGVTSEIFMVDDLKKFCLEKSLNYSSMYNLSRGKIKKYRTWKIEKLQ